MRNPADCKHQWAKTAQSCNDPEAAIYTCCWCGKNEYRLAGEVVSFMKYGHNVQAIVGESPHYQETWRDRPPLL